MGEQSELPRIEADFNYGGRVGDQGVVYLHGKVERHDLAPFYARQFQAADVEPIEGLNVILVEPGDIEVRARLESRDRGWVAVYAWSEAPRT